MMTDFPYSGRLRVRSARSGKEYDPPERTARHPQHQMRRSVRQASPRARPRRIAFGNGDFAAICLIHSTASRFAAGALVA